MLPRRAFLLAPLALSACVRPPRDSQGGLQTIREQGVVRVGVVENPPWVRLAGGHPSGLEPELIERWAAGLGARPVYRGGDLDELAEALHRGEILVLAAGLERKTPYKKKLALTEAYLQVEENGRKTQRALAVTQGESAVLFSLDRFLGAQDEAALRARVRAGAPA